MMKMMKTINALLLLIWSVYLLLEMPYLKPSDNWILWLIGVVTIFCTVINAIIFIISQKQEP